MRASRRSARQFTMAHGLMLLAGLVTFLTVSSVLRDRQETVEVLVANHELVAGSGLEAISFTTIQIHADSELVGQLATPASLSLPGQLGRDLGSGEPLLASDIRPMEEDNALRTIAIPVWRSTISGLGLRIGDRVDLIGADSEGRLRFVVTDSAVSRLPASTTAGAFGSEAGRESWITVQVTDQEALDIALALRAGDIEIVRSTGAATLTVDPASEMPDTSSTDPATGQNSDPEPGQEPEPGPTEDESTAGDDSTETS